MKTPEALSKKVDLFKAGEQSAFEGIYAESYKYLHTCVIHIVKDEDTAQDMLQDTYVEICKNIGQLRSSADFLSWAATIANRKCYAFIRKNHDVLVDTQTDEDGSEHDFFESVPDDESFIPENIFDHKEKIRLIRDIIDSLSDIQRACVIGFYYNEQKQDEIAQELGIPVNTVKSHLNRAKAKIKEAVGDVEKKQGVKLYSFSPFMLMLLSYEIKAFAAKSAVPAMGAALTGAATAGKGIAAASAGKTAGSAAIKTAIAAAKTKIAIGAATVAVGASAVAGVAYVKSHQTPEPEAPAHEYEYIDACVDEQAIMDSVLVYDTPLSQYSEEDAVKYWQEREEFFSKNHEKETYYIHYKGGDSDNSDIGWEDIEPRGEISSKTVMWLVFTGKAGDASENRRWLEKEIFEPVAENDRDGYQYEENVIDNSESFGCVYQGGVQKHKDALPDDVYIFDLPYGIHWNHYIVKKDTPEQHEEHNIIVEYRTNSSDEEPYGTIRFKQGGMPLKDYMDTILSGSYEKVKEHGTVEFQNGKVSSEPQDTFNDNETWTLFFDPAEGTGQLAKEFPRLLIAFDEHEKITVLEFISF